MTSTKTASEKTERKKRTPTPSYSAPDKVQAVLAVWTERCKPADVCRQLSINWITFNHWQRRAMEGMLQALENRVNLTKGEVVARLGKKWDDDVKAFDDIFIEILTVADTLTDGILKQFPDKFK